MFQKFTSYLAALVFALALTACATPGNQQGEVEIRSGVIEQITPVDLQHNTQPGVGAVVGGLAGLGIGSLIGGGTGRDVAMVLGTVGGAFAGHQTEKYVRAEKQTQVTVHFEDGSTRTFAQEGGNRWQVGDRVRLSNGSLLPN